MTKYKCKDCGAAWYGRGEGKVCLKCGGKLESVSENTADKKSPGVGKGFLEPRLCSLR